VVIYKKKYNIKIVLHLTKTETPLVIWLNIVTIVAQSVRFLPAYMREDVHATRQLPSAMPNMQTLLQFTTLV